MPRVPAAFFAAALLACGSLPLAASAAEPSGAFLMRLGGDTLAVERFERSGGVLQATLVFRITGTRMTWRTSEGPDGQVATMEFEARALTDPETAPPRQAGRMLFRDDSVLVETQPGGLQRTATKRGASPFANPSVLMIAEMARRTMPAPLGRVEAPLFVLEGGATVTATVTRPAADSVVVAFAGVSFCFGLDEAGDVVRGRIPEQGIEILRVASLSDAVVSLPAPDYSAPEGATWTAEEVRVRTRGGFDLAGTLTRPIRSVPVPCVVTITGSGQQDRDESVGLVKGYRPFREIAEALARRGVAVLRLDDRGVGGSAGPVRGATTEDFAHDIEDAVAWVRARPDLDGSRVALAGHSEGGIIAPMVAAQDRRLRGIALLAAPAWTGRRVLDDQRGRSIDRHVAEAQRDSIRRAAAAETESRVASDAWWRFFVTHDPLETLRRVRVPVLVLHGATDWQVSAEQAPLLAKTLEEAGNRQVTVHVFEGLNHLFLPDPDGDPAGYPRLEHRQLAPAVLEQLTEWLVQRLR